MVVRAPRDLVFTLDAAAWALHALGRAHEAKAYIHEALAHGTNDARLFYHAAAIEAASGDAVAARAYIARASDLAHTLLPSERAGLASIDGD